MRSITGGTSEDNNVIKVIKTESDYATALANIGRLMDRDPPSDSAEANELELLTMLVGEYEANAFPVEVPDPIEAIRFRMEQQDLSPRDLIPFIGSRSKVSEVLSGKRPLTLAMIRALHSGLGIPARSLLQERSPSELEPDDMEWDRFPIRDMIARRWIDVDLSVAKSQPADAIRQFMAPLGMSTSMGALYRKATHLRSARSMDRFALFAWTARIGIRALQNPPVAGYTPGSVDIDFMREVAKLSWSDSGPVLAQEFLSKHGIALVIEPHLPRTYLDGVAMMMSTGTPVIGLSVRYDRLDNFWFCFMHELAHVSLHLDQENDPFLDDLDSENPDDPREKEADKLAGEALIPELAWKNSPAASLPTPEAAERLAKQLRIHPAIVAGHMRHHFKSYRILNQLVGHGEVRRCFPDVTWS